jgi:serine/threonine protein kinase
MGEVYRARDTRLDRTVAVKILPAEFAHNAQLRLRFEREAKVISSLTHPHICTLHDVGQHEGVDYLVMEYLEGESLADRIARGPLPIEDALIIAIQITSALDKAHKSSIVHRDLKPGNIILTTTGAKLLDFGLAKSGGQASAVLLEGATEHKPLTQEGTIVGTFQYMAPEQLEGKEADARTDIFALGAVLYEMITGRRAFEGKSKVSLIAAILDHDPPPITSVQPLSPPALDRLIRTCLAKDPDDRWQTAHDVLLQLKWISEGGSLAGVPAPVAVRRRHREFLWTTMSALALIAAVSFGGLWYRETTRPRDPVTTSILPPEKADFEFESGSMVLSPDGRRIAFLALNAEGKRTIWVRPLGSVSAQSLAGTEDALNPFWSADSRFLGFFAAAKLKKIDTAGGPPQSLCDAPIARGGAWSKDGTIVFTPTSSDGLYKISASGGVPVALTKLDKSENTHRWPFALPDGKHVLFYVGGGGGFTGGGTRIDVVSLQSGQRTKLFRADSSAVYAVPGYVLFRRERSLVAQPFDLKHLRAVGEVFPVAEEVRVSSLGNGIFSVSQNGLLAYQSGGALGQSQLMWVDRNGKLIGNIGAPADYRHPALSHDGRKLAVQITDANASNGDIWVIDLARATSTRLTFDPANDFVPLWSADDKYIYFATNRNDAGDLYRKPASGLGNDEEVIRMPGFTLGSDLSRDGRYIAFSNIDPDGKRGWNTWTYSVADKRSTPFLQSQFNEFWPHFSPDGKWLVYQSDESGKVQIYVQPFPATGGKWQVSTDGGTRPRWSSKGNEIFYVLGSGKIMVAEVRTSGTFEAGIPKPLFDMRPKGGPDQRYTVTPDASRFVINNSVKDEVKAPITLVQNWAAGRPR